MTMNLLLGLKRRNADPVLTVRILKDILKIFRKWDAAMSSKQTLSKPIANQIAFRYRAIDSATGITRETAKRLAKQLGVDETQVIHLALHQLAVKTLPQYESDNGPLTATQLRQIGKSVPQSAKCSLRSSLFDTEAA
jgi:hypothetical protein